MEGRCEGWADGARRAAEVSAVDRPRGAVICAAFGGLAVVMMEVVEVVEVVEGLSC